MSTVTPAVGVPELGFVLASTATMGLLPEVPDGSCVVVEPPVTTGVTAVGEFSTPPVKTPPLP